jgi:tetratricopeptide (TPR) repeat protein
VGAAIGYDQLVSLAALRTLKAYMASKPQFFRLPVAQFDLNLISANARQVGTESFKDAVVSHFGNQYAQKGLQAVIFVDDEEIQVLVVPRDSNPFEFVLTMLQSGRIAEAIPFLEALNKADPANVQYLYNLGIAHSELGHFDEAIIRLKRAVVVDPTHAHAWTAVGVAYQRMGKPELAMEPMRKAVEADPTDGYAHRNYGALLMGAGRELDALEHMRLARKALPHDPQATYGLAAALDRVGGDANEDEADELYKVVIERWPADTVAEHARQARTRRAHQGMRSAVGGGLRPDVMMYLLGALKTFEAMTPAQVRQIGFEVAMKGQSGLDINDSAQKYKLNSLPGEFSGMHLVSIMYVAFKKIDPTLNSGIDLSTEYEAALQLAKQG